MIDFKTGQITFNNKYTIFPDMNYSEYTETFLRVNIDKIDTLNGYTHLHINNLRLNNTKWNIIVCFTPNNILYSVILRFKKLENKSKSYTDYISNEKKIGIEQNLWFKQKYKLDLPDKNHYIEYDWGQFISGYHPKFEKALIEFKYN